MKKFWIVLLALGLVAGFALSASAADIKFSGQYYVVGLYDDNPTMKDNDARNAGTGNYAGALGTNTYKDGAQAFYTQRFRIGTEIKVAEGLSLVTRFDMLEKKWGDTTWASNTGNETLNRVQGGGTGALSGQTPRIQENLEFERAYLDFTTKIGRFLIGYQNQMAWGTDFLDSNVTHAGIKYLLPIGPLTVVAQIEKRYEANGGTTPLNSVGSNSLSGVTDGDINIYDLGAIYKFGAGEAGVLYQYMMDDSRRPAASGGITTRINLINPYAKVKFGPIYVEAEGAYGFGDLAKYESGATTITAEAFAFYLHARGDFGPAYAGLQFIYARGDDPSTTDKVEGSLICSYLGAGSSLSPMLIMYNDDLNTWVGNRIGYTNQATIPLGATQYYTGRLNSLPDNVWFYKGYVGFKPTPKADIQMRVAYAYVDKKPRVNPYGPTGTDYVSDQLGTEVDLVATYKIFDNLEYMIGGGYWFTGDYFKGVDASNKVGNDFLLMHKLTLNF